ncbi:hypothetical protein BDV95DRAFT_671315 [Massariosphaeria phaeospora]|uniref:Uncharacterized protein n=1 Tax=Massariosphaeria phaeospora TaxID=100035 RepID=A0A7C8M442_9PLEO|nr:hypothetical protein BDV95DRAFT_671315 [Massariosphaeria phaeospora]
MASSKAACFLCNAFITMHGKDAHHQNSWTSLSRMEITINPASHWFGPTIQRRACKTDPNESTHLTLPHSASTLQSSYKAVETTSTVGKLRRCSGFISGSSSMGAKSVYQELESGTSRSPADPSTCKAVQALIQGQTVLIARQARSYAAGSLTLRLEYAAKALSLASTSSPNNNAHTLEWLS